MRFLKNLLLMLCLAAGAAHAQTGSMSFGSDAVSAAPSVSGTTSNNYWFYNGGTGNGTQVNDWWLNKVGGELDAIIETCYPGAVSLTTRNQAIGCITAQMPTVPAIRTGSGTVTSGTLSITFAPAFGTGVVPKVTITDRTANTWTASNVTLYGASAISNAGFTVNAFTWSGSAWVASTSANFSYIATP